MIKERKKSCRRPQKSLTSNGTNYFCRGFQFWENTRPQLGKLFEFSWQQVWLSLRCILFLVVSIFYFIFLLEQKDQESSKTETQSVLRCHQKSKIKIIKKTKKISSKNLLTMANIFGLGKKRFFPILELNFKKYFKR
jgi:hypothetical protein